jgi:F0F1-type ATP synthase delta subunit
MKKSSYIYLDELFSDLLLVRDVMEFKNELEKLKVDLYEIRGNIDEKLAHNFSGVQAEGWKRLFVAEDVGQDDPTQYLRCVKEVERILDDLPRVTLVLAQNMPHRIVRRISDWFASNFRKRVILDIQVDPENLGGVVVLDKGHYHDYSLTRKLEEMAEKGELQLSRLFEA